MSELARIDAAIMSIGDMRSVADDLTELKGPGEFVHGLIDEVERYRRQLAEFTAQAAALREALVETLPQAEGCWLDHYGNNPEGAPLPHHIVLIRQALAASPATLSARREAEQRVVEAARILLDECNPDNGFDRPPSLHACEVLNEALAALEEKSR